MATYRTAIREAEKQLSQQDKEGLAKLFMLELTRNAGIDLYMDYENAVPEALLDKYTDGVARMLNDEPMQYILGYSWFYGYQLTVNPDVLIPRPETEELVANVLARIDERRDAGYEVSTLADVGCGSGAIGIALKLEEPSLQVWASDISESALHMARKNASDLNADVTFLQGSMLDPFVEKGIQVDVIVCNPPYIPVHQEIDASVKDYEPNVALFGGEDGLYFYRMVFDHCQSVLKPDGFMAFEIGYDQKDALLAEVNRRFPQAKAEVLIDMYGKDRMLFVDFLTEK